ncbi:Ig-like domain-containing protein [Vulgatibacter incomptus]|uniref:BNR repeat domain protein n=1 Tax=Vulgatibacter incomptus TaxID=1391653 RepID=A0A0K1PES2_9BACT|nr:Ig-like domain-containing protein [Vulgatibacter incomptus]AKU92015.1 BNR repeat domain protein [Vulgatibacter incomptus]
MKRIIVLLPLLVAFGCSSDKKESAISRIEIDPSELVLDEQDTRPLIATAFAKDGTVVEDVTLVWASSDSEIVSVTKEGLVKGETFGKATITASAGGAEGSIEIVVNEVEPVSIGIVPKTLRVPVDGTLQIVAELKSANGRLLKRRNLEWTSSDPSTIDIDPTGLATGRKLNATPVTVTATFGDLTTTSSARTVHRFAQLVAGDRHTCALTLGGAAWCWGSNAAGALGSEGARSNLPVRFGAEQAFSELAAGGDRTCGVSAEGKVFCWGGGAAVAAVQTPPLHSLTMGQGHTCGLTDEGKAWCWGSDSHGQTGNGSQQETAQPAEVKGGMIFDAIAAGGDTTCGVDDAGKAWCWGSDSMGQLGKSSAGSDAANPEQVSGGRFFTYIALGSAHACGMEINGAVWCWGSNNHGQLGRGTAGGSAPAKVSGSRSFVALAAGSGFSSAIAQDGEGFAWGENNLGQLGVGDSRDKNAPEAFTGAFRWQQIVHGGSHACGINVDGLTYCWGSNDNGQAGIGEDDLSLFAATIGYGQEPLGAN